MKYAFIFIALLLLAGIFWLELDARSARLAEQKRREAATQSENLRLAESIQVEALRSIVSNFDFQYKLLHNSDFWENMPSNKMADAWTNYYAAYNEANRQLAMTQLDLTIPLPSTKYIDDEVAAGLLTRTR